MTQDKHYLSQIKLGEWFSNAQYYYRPRNDKERSLMHSCYEEGYNNGYEQGKPKWHNLQENPDDLPDNGRRVLVKDKSRREYDIACLCRSKDSVDFWSYEHFTSCISDNYVIAWCELPKFEG